MQNTIVHKWPYQGAGWGEWPAHICPCMATLGHIIRSHMGHTIVEALRPVPPIRFRPSAIRDRRSATGDRQSATGDRRNACNPKCNAMQCKKVLTCRITKMGEVESKSYPSWHQVGPNGAQVDPSELQVGPSWPQVGPGWPQVGPSWP